MAESIFRLNHEILEIIAAEKKMTQPLDHIAIKADYLLSEEFADVDLRILLYILHPGKVHHLNIKDIHGLSINGRVLSFETEIVIDTYSYVELSSENYDYIQAAIKEIAATSFRSSIAEEESNNKSAVFQLVENFPPGARIPYYKEYAHNCNSHIKTLTQALHYHELRQGTIMEQQQLARSLTLSNVRRLKQQTKSHRQRWF